MTSGHPWRLDQDYLGKVLVFCAIAKVLETTSTESHRFGWGGVAESDLYGGANVEGRKLGEGGNGPKRYRFTVMPLFTHLPLSLEKN